MNLHEIIRPEKRQWRKIRETRDYETIRQGYNQLNALPSTDAEMSDYASVAKELSEFIGKDAKILDAACGRGLMSRALREAGFSDVSAFDISDENVKAVQPYARKAFRSSCEDITEQGDSYDAIICKDAIEHVMDIKQALAELHRILKPGGYLYISTDNAWWQTMIAVRGWLTFFLPSKKYQRLVQPIDDDYAPWEMRKYLLAAGFRVIRFSGLGGFAITNTLVEKVIGGPTANHSVFKFFTSKMMFIVQKN